MDDPYSIVQYVSEQHKAKCGYCKQLSSSAVYGMWTHSLTVHDYQDLIDRGWRRSGKYCYKPIMDITCCPMYTIRCEALHLKLSKSQKKILKRVNKFLTDGAKDRIDDNSSENSYEKHEGASALELMPTTSHKPMDIDTTKINIDNMGGSGEKSEKNMEETQIRVEPEMSSKTASSKTLPSSSKTPQSSSKIVLNKPTKSKNQLNESKSKDFEPPKKLEDLSEKISDDSSPFAQGEGMDPSRPPCKKAKLVRIEKKRQKLALAGLELNTTKQTQATEGKSLEQFLSEIPPNAQHKLRVSLVRTSPESEEWLRTRKMSHDVYVKYQMAIHGSTQDKCSEQQFTRFLVESPLKALYTQHGPIDGYGSFHQQYWLDDNLIAVGVIDILPKCVSSVYFFYDPDYSSLSLGTYGSLRELNFTRELHKISPDLEYYYMGYYIHSCPKMKYKASLSPSFLLCPETYNWFAIEQCLTKLNIDAYARFNDDSDAKDANSCTVSDLKFIPILYDYEVYQYGQFKKKFSQNFDSELLEYSNLVGKKCATSMIFYKF